MGQRDWQNDDEDDPSNEWQEEDESGDDTIPCPHCRAEIYEDSVRCPQCGTYITGEAMHHFRKPIWIIVGTVLALAAFVAYNFIDIGVE